MPTSIIRQKFGGVVGAFQLPGRGERVAVLQAGLVAMVAVGDEDRLRCHQALQGGLRHDRRRRPRAG